MYNLDLAKTEACTRSVTTQCRQTLMILRVIKYLLNLFGLYLFQLDIASKFIVSDRYPDCITAKTIIWYNINSLLPDFVLFLVISTACNFIGERYLEKRKDSKEFIFMLIVSVLIIIGLTTLTALLYYKHCGE